ncbi:MAG: hypothetical protein WBQ64_14560, partial [Terriglobales bacterium]
MNVTPPTSGAANAHGTSPLPAANSSLADFLLAKAPADSTQDFRAIAASLFGVESTTTAPAQAPVLGPDAAKKPAGLQDESKSRKSEEATDPTAGMAHPELTVPLPVPPAAALDVTPKQEAATDPVSLLEIKTALKDPAMFAGRNLSNRNDKAADAASSLLSTPSKMLGTITPPSSLPEADTPAPTVVMGKVQKELPIFGSENPHLPGPTAPPSDLIQAKELAARAVASGATITTARKPADGSGQPPSSESAKPVLTAAANPDRPAPPTHVPIEVATVLLPPVATVEVASTA